MKTSTLFFMYLMTTLSLEGITPHEYDLAIISHIQLLLKQTLTTVKPEKRNTPQPKKTPPLRSRAYDGCITI